MLKIYQNPRQKQCPVYKETIPGNTVWARYRLNLFCSLELFQDKNDGVYSIDLLSCCKFIHNEGQTNYGCYDSIQIHV